MRTALLVIGGITGLFFATSLALTFFAHDYLKRLAQDFVIDKTIPHSDSVVNLADEAANAPGIKRILKERELLATRNEIAEYREDPRAYVAKIVAGDVLPAVFVGQGPDALVREQVLSWKHRIHEYFDQTMNRLLRDLRIFCGTNLVAALLVFVLSCRASSERRRHLLVLSTLLLMSLAYSIYLFVDSMTYFRILIGSYMRLWYPAVVCTMFLGMMIGDRKSRSPTPTA